MSAVKVISNLNNRNSMFFGYVMGIQKENPKRTVLEIATQFSIDVDDSVEIETLVRRYNDVKSTMIRYKDTMW